MKCLQCGTELNGNKFCTNCGAPAPQETTGTVCPNCGEAVEGKFCTKCGTPVGASVQPEQNVVGDTVNNTAENLSDAVNQPVDYQNPYADNTQPVQYNANTNQSNTGYTGQQFTNQPNVDPNGKKPMSGGKIAVIIVSIVVGLMIILGIIVGVVACSAVNSVINVAKDAVNTYDDDLSSAANYLSSYLDKYSSSLDDYNSYLDDYSSKSEVTDPATGLVFEESEKYDGWAVVDYNTPDYSVSKITLEIPETFQGKEVVEIKRLYIYDNDYTDEGYLKIIIPGTVKVIDSYSMSFLGDINEVVISDGVEIIERNAFIGDNDLIKIYIPASVTEINEDCGIGFDESDEPIKDFTLYCPKGSAAEKYAKDHKFNCVVEDSVSKTVATEEATATTEKK
ncbi:MAG: zinc ribbon domain-containing protein [Ruminococcus sp.]|nr:zinc ribbon domain-containing protein [Ruminococcus sp.]